MCSPPEEWTATPFSEQQIQPAYTDEALVGMQLDTWAQKAPKT